MFTLKYVEKKWLVFSVRWVKIEVWIVALKLKDSIEVEFELWTFVPKLFKLEIHNRNLVCNNWILV